MRRLWICLSLCVWSATLGCHRPSKAPAQSEPKAGTRRPPSTDSSEKSPSDLPVILYESLGAGFFEKTFFLESDGTVIMKRQVGYRFGYETFRLQGAEKERVEAALRSPALIKAAGRYGITNVTDISEIDLVIGGVGVGVIGIPEASCEVDKSLIDPYTEFEPPPAAFTAACQLIARLRNDARAKPWHAERLRVTFRTMMPDDKRVGEPAVPWPPTIPPPRQGFRAGRTVEEYDAKYLPELEKLIPTHFGAQHVTAGGWSGWVDYDPIIPGDTGGYWPP